MIEQRIDQMGEILMILVKSSMYLGHVVSD